MVRIIISLMVIFLMNERGTAFFPTTFLNASNLISWGNKIFNEETLYGNKFDYISLIKLNKLLVDVDRISNDFDAILNKINQTQSKRRSVYVDNSNDNLSCFIFKNTCKKIPDQSPKLVFHEFMNEANNFYTDIRNKIIEAQPTYKVSNDSMNSLLDTAKNLSITLQKIYQLIVPTTHNSTTTFINLIITNANLFSQHNCNKYLSAQQQMFATYINLIITEMKGLAVLTYVHSIYQHLFRVLSISQTLMAIKQNFENRTMNYFNYINQTMALLPRDIHRCEILTPQRGENFIEFTRYEQAMLFSSTVLNPNNPKSENCKTKCEDFDLTVLNQKIRTNTHNCQTLGYSNDVDICIRSYSSTILSWWRTPNRTYGNSEKCPFTNGMSFGNEDRVPIRFCYMCMCSVTETLSVFQDKILRISVTSQMSDIANNMIVVGVKFVVYDRAVHLQILQSKHVPGKIIDNSTMWKKLDDFPSTGDTKFRYSALGEFSGQLYLDDVMLPPKYAVTGVRLASRVDPIGFYLQVHGTPFDVQTGKLNPEDGTWFTRANWEFSKTPDYERNRIKIELDDFTIPTECRGYDYNQETNKLIQFRHSSAIKDAGQNTIPFIDAQPVESYPSFPLGGIGLFHRNRYECGGYIAPRLFALDISQYTYNN